jgi:proliferating cell nuclear antigen PCNA
MKFSIVSKAKKDVFLSLFQLLKNCSSVVNLLFSDKHLYIQGMDKSHVCLFDITIDRTWFSSYEFGHASDCELCLDTTFFHNVLSMNQEHHTIHLEFDPSDDYAYIHLTNNDLKKSDFDRFFKLPLADLEVQLLEIPDVEYDAEFSLSSKKIVEIATQLLLFGDTMEVKCNEDKIDLCSRGVSGEMTVNIPIDDLSEYSISEGETVELAYSLNYIQKMCLTTKLSTDIQFSVSSAYPLRIQYNLGFEPSSGDSRAIFFIAPKVTD